MNKQLLKAEMVRYGDTQESLAAAMGISLSRLNAKINSEHAEFRQNEILFIKRRYALDADSINAIFFDI
ncbi:MAG: hypothetical protein VZQ81_01855 [Succiniclasticum sp.]|nr:hypothetical protein [Succiniclasticum sp.]